MARTSSLNCLSCRNPYQTPDSLNCLPLFTENPFFHWKVLRRIPFPKISSEKGSILRESPGVKKCKRVWESVKIHEDGNDEKLTVKKWWLFGCRFFTVYAEFFTVYMGRKQWKKHLIIDMIFFTVGFSQFTPSRKMCEKVPKRFCPSVVAIWFFSDSWFLIVRYIEFELCNVIRCLHCMLCNNARSDITTKLSQSQFCNVTLPALQKTFVDLFFEFAWEFCIENWRGFLGEFFAGLRFPRNEARKLQKKKNGGNSEQNSGQNSGWKFEKSGELSFCVFSALM